METTTHSAGRIRGPRTTRRSALVEYFRIWPRRWIDGRLLSAVAGTYAWRTRVSELRRPPHSLTIENRQRRVRRPGGETITISEYRYLPDAPAALEER